MDLEQNHCILSQHNLDVCNWYIYRTYSKMSYNDSSPRKSCASHFSNGNAEIEAEIQSYESELKSVLADAAAAIEMKYAESVPEMITTCALLTKLQGLNKQVEDSIDQISREVKFAEAKFNSNSLCTSKLAALEACKQKIDDLVQIEAIIYELWHLPTEECAMKNAEGIDKLGKKLRDLTKSGKENETILLEKIFPILQEELVVLRGTLEYTLNVYWDNIFTFHESSSGDVISMKISIGDLTAVNEKLNAMQKLGILDHKLNVLSNSLMQQFCLPLIRAEDPNNVFNFVGTQTSMTADHDFIMKKHGSKCEKPGKISIFESLKMFFKHFCAEFGSIEVDGKPFVQLIGDKMSDELIRVVVSEYLSLAILNEANSKDTPDALIRDANDFHQHLVGLKFFTNDTIRFDSYAENFASIFINRRCSKIMLEARRLICESFLELVTVGSGDSEEQDAVHEFCKKTSCFSMGLKKDEQYPKLLRFLQCKVSSSTVKLVELMRSTISAAADADSSLACARTILTVRNIVDLYILTAPRYHVEVRSVPQMAAVFYNNCYFLCHRLMTASVNFDAKITEKLQSDYAIITYLDAIPKLRELAADVMEAVLAQCRRQVSNLLSEDESNGIFVGLDNLQRFSNCEKILNGCLRYMEQVREVWREVLATTVLAKCMGDITDFFLRRISKKIIAIEDIRQCDAEAMVVVLNRVIRAVEALFMMKEGETTTIHRFSESTYYHMKELVFVLNASLQDIFDRWCDGNGLLAEWMCANDVRQLIKALFQNTDKRAFILSKIF